MKKIVFVLLVLFHGAMTHAQDFQKRKATVLPSSELTIIGDSNIAAFQCEFDTSYLEGVQTIMYRQTGNTINFNGAVLSLQNRGFDCGSKGINRDFHDLLRSDQHPKIRLEVNKIDLSSPTLGLAHVIITIAGKHRTYDVPVKIRTGEVAEFKGKLEVNIKNYDLEPPKKLFGMIVVKDIIEIEFDLHIKI